MNSAVAIKDLHVAFDRKKVLNGISINVPAGSAFTILGGSGSGKSVLLKTIMGLIRYDSGTISIDGKVQKSQTVPCDFGMLFQNSALFDSLTVLENIVFGMHGLDAKEARSKAIEMLRLVDLEEDILGYYPESLSGGMKKRVSLARTIARRCKVLLLDEPTTGLDPITAQNINDLILKLMQRLSLTTIMVTHDMHSVLAISQRIAMIDSGIVIWDGTTEEFTTTDLPLARQFMEAARVG